MNAWGKDVWGPIAKDLERQTRVQTISLFSLVNYIYVDSINHRKNIELT